MSRTATIDIVYSSNLDAEKREWDEFIAYCAAHQPTITPVGGPSSTTGRPAATTTFGGIAMTFPYRPVASEPAVTNNYYVAPRSAGVPTVGPASQVGAFPTGTASAAAVDDLVAGVTARIARAFAPAAPSPVLRQVLGLPPTADVPPPVASPSRWPPHGLAPALGWTPDVYSPLPAVDAMLGGPVPQTATGGAGGRLPPPRWATSGAAGDDGSPGRGGASGDSPWARLSAAARATADDIGRLGATVRRLPGPTPDDDDDDAPFDINDVPRQYRWMYNAANTVSSNPEDYDEDDRYIGPGGGRPPTSLPPGGGPRGRVPNGARYGTADAPEAPAVAGGWPGGRLPSWATAPGGGPQLLLGGGGGDDGDDGSGGGGSVGGAAAGGGGGPLARYGSPTLRIPNGGTTGGRSANLGLFGRMYATEAIREGIRAVTGLPQYNEAKILAGNDPLAQLQADQEERQRLGSGLIGSVIQAMQDPTGAGRAGVESVVRGIDVQDRYGQAMVAGGEFGRTLRDQVATEGATSDDERERLRLREERDKRLLDARATRNRETQAAADVRRNADVTAQADYQRDYGLLKVDSHGRWTDADVLRDQQLASNDAAFRATAKAADDRLKQQDDAIGRAYRQQADRLNAVGAGQRQVVLDRAAEADYTAAGASAPDAERLALLNRQAEEATAARQRLPLDLATGRPRDPSTYRPGTDPTTGRHYDHAIDPTTGQFDQAAADYEAMTGRQGADRRLLGFRQATGQAQRDIAAQTEVDVTTATGTGNTLVAGRAGILGRFNAAMANPDLTGRDRQDARDVRDAQNLALTTETARRIAQLNATAASLSLANSGQSYASRIALLQGQMGISDFDASGQPNFYGLDPAQAKTPEDRRMIVQQIDAQRRIYSGQRGAMRQEQWRTEYRGRGESDAIDATIRGDTLGASMYRVNANFRAETTDDQGRMIDPGDPEYIRADRERRGQSRLSRFDDQQRRFGVSMTTREIGQDADEQDLRNRRMPLSAEVQAAINAGSNQIIRTDVDLRGDANAGQRQAMDAQIRRSTLSRITGLTDPRTFGIRGEEVGAFDYFGDLNNQSYKDLGEATTRGAGAGADLDAAEQADPFSLPGVRTKRNTMGFNPARMLSGAAGLFGGSFADPTASADMPGYTPANQLATTAPATPGGGAGGQAATNMPTADQMTALMTKMDQVINAIQAAGDLF